MKENVLDVLMFLFENYFYEEPEETPDPESLQNQLVEAGFSQNEVDKAFDWLEGLRIQQMAGQGVEHVSRALRVYTPEEEQRLDLDSRGFIHSLESMGVLDPVRREQVIDRVMALDSENVDLDDLRWIILMVLFNQPGQEAAFAWMENYMFDDQHSLEH